jgi:hypothetical protein
MPKGGTDLGQWLVLLFAVYMLYSLASGTPQKKPVPVQTPRPDRVEVTRDDGGYATEPEPEKEPVRPPRQDTSLFSPAPIVRIPTISPEVLRRFAASNELEPILEEEVTQNKRLRPSDAVRPTGKREREEASTPVQLRDRPPTPSIPRPMPPIGPMQLSVPLAPSMILPIEPMRPEPLTNLPASSMQVCVREQNVPTVTIAPGFSLPGPSVNFAPGFYGLNYDNLTEANDYVAQERHMRDDGAKRKPDLPTTQLRLQDLNEMQLQPFEIADADDCHSNKRRLTFPEEETTSLSRTPASQSLLQLENACPAQSQSSQRLLQIEDADYYEFPSGITPTVQRTKRRTEDVEEIYTPGAKRVLLPRPVSRGWARFGKGNVATLEDAFQLWAVNARGFFRSMDRPEPSEADLKGTWSQMNDADNTPNEQKQYYIMQTRQFQKDAKANLQRLVADDNDAFNSLQVDHNILGWSHRDRGAQFTLSDKDRRDAVSCLFDELSFEQKATYHPILYVAGQGHFSTIPHTNSYPQFRKVNVQPRGRGTSWGTAKAESYYERIYSDD